MKTRIAALALALAAPLAAADPFSLDAYLAQVRENNPALRAARASDTAYAVAAKEPLTAFSPMLNGELRRYDDQTEPTVNLFSPVRTLAWGGGLGLGKLWSTGTYTSVDWQSDQSVIEFPQGGFIGDQDNVGQQFSLTLNQPLWRNFNAAEVKAGVAQATAGADAARAGNLYGAQALLFQARGAYIQLATLREVERIQSESLERNGKILEWTKRKYADNLADKVDVLQVEAALRQVALALAQTREEEAKAVVVFNHLRGLPREEPVDDLALPVAPAELPRASLERPDLAAAEAALRASDAQVESVRQRFTPDFSVFAKLGFNERGTDAATALADSFKLEHPSTTVGLKLTANLDWGLYQEVLRGAKDAQGAGAEQVRTKKSEMARDWAQLREAFRGVTERLALARELVDVQGEKAEREKVRYRDGRTTNFQVLRFEDDYSLSRIQVLQLGAQAAVLDAQARYYNGEDKPW